MNNLHLLKYAFNTRSFYILGAGVSAGIIPLTNQQGAIIKERHLNHGVFPTIEIEVDKGERRLLGYAYDSDENQNSELGKRIHGGAIKAISYQSMTARKNISIPEQYYVFNILKYRSIIFNFNVDGLANRFCKRHIVLNAHGTIKPEITHSKEWDAIIKILLTYNIETPKIPNVLLPQREPLGTIKSKNYRIASRIFPFTKYVVIIGYSFGNDESELDDWESYLFFINLFKSFNKPILVISLSGADDLAHRLRENLQRRNIYPITAYWNYLSSAILVSRRMSFMHPHIKDEFRISLEYIYQQILDKEA